MLEVYNSNTVKLLEEKWDIKPEWVLNKKAYGIKKKLLSDPNYCWFVQKYFHSGFFKIVFPVRYNELSSTGSEYFNIVKTEYKPSIKKVLCTIALHYSDGSQISKTYKVSSSAYLERTKELRTKILEDIKNDLDRTYGYYASYEDINNFYITDCNMENGKLKKLFEIKDGVVIKESNKFNTGNILINFIKGEQKCGECGS